MKRGGPLRRVTPLKRGGPLRQRSRKREQERWDRIYTLEAVRHRDGSGCYAAGLVPFIKCGGVVDGHEIIPRGRWPGGHLVPGNVRLVCRRHHDWIHGHPIRATQLGLLGSRDPEV